jgi:hypothetical protein
MMAEQVDEHDPERERRPWYAGRGEQSREEGAGRDRWLIQWSAAASVSAVCWCSRSTVLAAAAA